MRCIVINLASAEERRQAIKKQFDKVNLTCELWPAVEAEALTIEQKQLVDHQQRAARAVPPIDVSALACLMSHMAVFRNLVEIGDDMLAVFEDDAILHTNLPGFLKALEGKAHKFDIIMLQGSARPYLPVYQVTSANTIGRIRYEDTGTYGYVITRTAAAHILKRFPFPVYEIDWILPRFWENGLRNVLWVNPPLVFHDSLLPSHIENTRKEAGVKYRLKLRRSPALLMKRYWFRIKKHLVRGYRFRQLRKQDSVIDPLGF